MAEVKLKAASCILRAPVLADCESLARHGNDRDVWRNLRDRFPHPYAADDARAWTRSVADQDPRTSFVIDVDGAACGSIGLRLGTDIERVSAEVGYWLGRAFWGRGIATSAVEAVCSYAFDELGLRRVFATPITWNPASFRVLEKAGFEREGIMRNASFKDGTLTDMALFAKIR
jgi:ribosomal-protein-alanine N-acetyltransferase